MEVRCWLLLWDVVVVLEGVVLQLFLIDDITERTPLRKDGCEDLTRRFHSTLKRIQDFWLGYNLRPLDFLCVFRYFVSWVPLIPKSHPQIARAEEVKREPSVTSDRLGFATAENIVCNLDSANHSDQGLTETKLAAQNVRAQCFQVGCHPNQSGRFAL